MDDSPRDERLWKIAKKRAGFQRSLVAYVVFSAFFWLIWYFTAGRHGYNRNIPWPVWPMLGWGIGIIFQYLNAYGGNKEDLEQKEYEKLRDRSGNNNTTG